VQVLGHWVIGIWEHRLQLIAQPRQRCYQLLNNPFSTRLQILLHNIPEGVVCDAPHPPLRRRHGSHGICRIYLHIPLLHDI
jgi:hypothetical protein